ncbi:MAG: ferritin-like domain-containing protein [Deltaproteobacteria bacterium]|nr:ferritin-like domain-containing protein [Deltaproteobacteria bacterium]
MATSTTRSNPTSTLPAPTAGDRLRESLNLKFMSLLLSTPRGRAHLLAQCADAESTGESRIFDQALGGVDDANLKRMITRHRDDELRHERLFRERLAATGVTDLPDLRDLQVVDRIDAALGGFLEKPITDARGVMEAYCLLQVLEERAVMQFPIFAKAFATIDPATTRVFEEVLEDERRHLLYCVAVSRRYAPSEEAREACLNRLRAIEAEEYKANQAANMRHAFKHGYVRGLASIPWRLLALAAPLIPAAGTPHGRAGAKAHAVPDVAELARTAA